MVIYTLWLIYVLILKYTIYNERIYLLFNYTHVQILELNILQLKLLKYKFYFINIFYTTKTKHWIGHFK